MITYNLIRLRYLGEIMKKSEEEYLMLRDEILHLSNMENNIMNFFYVSVATILTFSLTQQDTMFILLPYIIIIPSYRLVLSKMKGIYKIGAYMYVFLEGKTFNWERRTSKFYSKLPNVFGGKVQSFNWPFCLQVLLLRLFLYYELNGHRFVMNFMK